VGLAVFESVDGDAFRRVELDREGKKARLDAIKRIADKANGFHRIDRELFTLRNHLLDELYGRIGE
jgi:hypothetical protein